MSNLQYAFDIAVQHMRNNGYQGNAYFKYDDTNDGGGERCPACVKGKLIQMGLIVSPYANSFPGTRCTKDISTLADHLEAIYTGLSTGSIFAASKLGDSSYWEQSLEMLAEAYELVYTAPMIKEKEFLPNTYITKEKEIA